jgi:hypothetical protein
MIAEVARRSIAFAAVVLASACGSSSEPTAPTPPASNEPSFSASIRGDVSTTVQGVPLSALAPTGYSESTNGGPSQSTPVVLLSFGSFFVGPPTLTIGLMGPIQTGTYVVRVVGSSPLGSRQELYGSISQPGAEGTRSSYSATSGTVTLTSVGTTMRGTFTLHYGRVVVFPANPTPGTSFPSSPASVDATGSFVVGAPLLTLP